MGRRLLCIGITAALAATTAILAGCGTDEPADTAASPTTESGQSPASSMTGSPSPAPTQAPRTANWTTLKPGDCLADAVPTDPAVVDVELVDCSQPHLAETFLRAPIPVDAALDGTATARCEAGFTQYTGTASAGSRYTVTYLIDSDQDRTFNNPLPSTVICLLQGAQGQPLTGSARG